MTRAGPTGAGLRTWVATAAALGAVAALVVVPLVELGAAATAEGLAPLRAAVTDPRTVRAAVATLWTAFAVTALALSMGTAAAFATERLVGRGRAALRVGLLLPLAVPPFVAALAWARAYGPAGLSERVLGAALPGVYGPAGVVVVMAVNAVPLVYLILAAGLASRAEPDLERAARSGGAGPWTAFATVTLPLLRPALAAAGALVFVSSINAFGIPAVLGTPAGFATVTTRIYADLVLSADPAAFTRVLTLACGLVAATAIVVGAVDVRRAATAVRTSAFAGGSVAPRPGGLPSAALWAYVALTTVVPLIALVLVALTRAVGLPPTPANWTGSNFAEALGGVGGQALRNSLLLAGGTATAALLLGGLLVALRRGRAGRRLPTVVTLTFAVPGSALAVAVLLAYGSLLRDTLLLIAIAYLAKSWALGHRTLAAAADAQPPALHWAARASGAGPAAALRTVTLPLLRPAIAGAWLLVFLFSLHELTMSSLLYGPGTATLAVAVLNAQQLGDVTVTAALAVALTLLVLIAGAILWALGGTAAGIREARR